MGIEQEQDVGLWRVDYGEIAKPEVVEVDWEAELGQFFQGGNVDVFAEGTKLAYLMSKVRELLEKGHEVEIVGKSALAGALSLGGVREFGELNNALRHWLIYHGRTGDESVRYSPDLSEAYREEWDEQVSDLDLKVSSPFDARMVKTRTMIKPIKSDEFGARVMRKQRKIPSRKGVVLEVGLAESKIAPFDVRWSMTEQPKNQIEQRLDRRWSGVNRMQMIRAKIVMKDGVLVAEYNPKDIWVAVNGKDNYQPSITDPVDKVGVTVSRMLLTGSMRQQVGLSSGKYQSESVFEWGSVATAKEVLESKWRMGEMISLTARQEVLRNLVLTGIVEPNMIRLVSQFGLHHFLPKHLREVDWARVEQTSIRTWIFSERFFSDLPTLIRVVNTLTGSRRLVGDYKTYMALSQIEQIDQNVMAMNWMLTGEFGEHREV